MFPTPVRYKNDIWNICPHRSGAFLIVGKDRALLVDTGHDPQNLSVVIREITPLPVIVVNTHSHLDHIGNNELFSSYYIDESEISRIPEELRSRAIPVKEGHIFDLGGRILEVVALPGHTPGSIGVYEKASRCLFAGDTVKKGSIFFSKGLSDINVFVKTLEKIIVMDPERIYVSHGDFEVGRDVLDRDLTAARAFRDGTLRAEPFEYAIFRGSQYLTEDGYGFFCPN